VHAQEVSNWEYAKRVPRVEQVALVMGVLVVEPGERARLLELARTAAEPSWLDTSKADVYIQYEREASEIFNWEPVLVPGLLQTAAYARSVLSGLGVVGAELERLVTLRQARRGLLTGPRASSLRAVVGEAVLRPEFIEPSVMVDQLRQNISLRVLPGSPSCHPGHSGSFVVLDFPQLPPILFLEQFRAGAYLYAEDQVADYRSAARTLAALALGEPESSALIGEVITGLGGVDG
jgi:hypothetical protein